MQWLLDRFATAADRDAFVHESERSTYGEVLARIEGFGKVLDQQGVKAGDKVAVLADYAPGVVCLILALALKGAIVIPLSRQAVVEEGAALVISANPGCTLQISAELASRGQTIASAHIAEVLDASIRGVRLHS